MNIQRLVLQEIKHRRLNFVLGLLSVAAAVASLVGAQTLLTADEVITDRLLTARQEQVEASVAEKQAAVEEAGKKLQDSVRKQMLELGFNVLILPQEQSLDELHLNGSLSATMQEEYVDRLASSNIMTINHLLPSVTRRVKWEEQDQEIIIVGTRGEVPLQHRKLKKMLLNEVAEGKIVVGHELAQKYNLKVDDTVQLNGREFTVSKTHGQRGSVDDVTVWISLATAQEMLGMQNQINAILALECGCTGDRISQIREEISGILPGTQVIERYSQALTRSESRAKAKAAAEAALADAKRFGDEQLAIEQQGRQDLEERHAGFASVLVPLIIVGSVLTIGLLALANSRARQQEIGILRAIGLSSKQLLLLFLSRAMILGILGAAAGIGIGLLAGRMLSTDATAATSWDDLFASSELTSVVILAPIAALVLAGVASWIPALLAARRDPAIVLQGEA